MCDRVIISEARYYDSLPDCHDLEVQSLLDHEIYILESQCILLDRIVEHCFELTPHFEVLLLWQG